MKPEDYPIFSELYNFLPEYKKEVNSSLNIETESKDNTAYGVYLDEKEVIKTKTNDNLLPVDFRYTDGTIF